MRSLQRSVGVVLLAGACAVAGCAGSGANEGGDEPSPGTATTTTPGETPSLRDPTSSSVHAASAIMSEEQLRGEMRRLFTDEVAYTRFYLIEAIGDAPGAPYTAGRFLQHQSALGDALRPFYGDEAAHELTARLDGRVSAIRNVVDAAKVGDREKLDWATLSWYANADRVAGFFESVDPYLRFQDVRPLLDGELDQVLTSVDARLRGDWASDAAAFDQGVVHGLHVADVIAAGIARQFPTLVTAVPGSEEEDLHLDQRKVWEDEVIWTRLLLVDASASTGDLQQTTARLLQNQDRIGVSVAPFVGHPAAEHLASLLREHATIAVDLVAAIQRSDATAVSQLRERWYANADRIGDELASANPAFADMRAMMRAYLDRTAAEITHQLAGKYEAALVDYDTAVQLALQMADRLGQRIAATSGPADATRGGAP